MVLNVATEVAGMMLHHATIEIFVAALRCPKKNWEIWSSRNDCGNKSVARNFCGRVCYIGQFFVQLMSQQNCETSWRKNCLLNSCFRTPLFCSYYFTVGYSFQLLLHDTNSVIGNSMPYRQKKNPQSFVTGRADKPMKQILVASQTNTWIYWFTSIFRLWITSV